MTKTIILSILWFVGLYLTWALCNSNSEFEEINVNDALLSNKSWEIGL